MSSQPKASVKATGANYSPSNPLLLVSQEDLDRPFRAFESLLNRPFPPGFQCPSISIQTTIYLSVGAPSF